MFRPWRVVVSGALAVAWAAMLALADVFLKFYLFPFVLALYGVFAISFPWHRKRRPVLALFGFLVLTAAAPFEVTDRTREGPPGFVPLVMGLPTQETHEAQLRGEVVVGGCAVSGDEPSWVLVW